jgi:UDP:flavonoid glycosyltransferase YjiC (YdhE family)
MVEMRQAASSKRILALISERGGGDAPPVITLVSALQNRGYTLSLLCDAKTDQIVRSAGLKPIVIPDELEQGRHVDPHWLVKLKERGETLTADTPNPLTIWADHCAPAISHIVQNIDPELLISSLFCSSLANLLAKQLSVPWCFVNPSFYFGNHGTRAWEQDFVGLAAGCFRYILLPHCDQANLVLHATDQEFDPPPPGIPSHHHYIGPLFWEPRQEEESSFLNIPGAPWALISLSTVPMGGEVAIAQSALKALAEKQVRTLLTLAPKYPRNELGSVPENAIVSGFVPHNQVLNNAALVVSHAGHGIVMKCLYHGVPMVLVPWARDQFGVAARAEALGVAVVVLREDCSDRELATAVNRVLEDKRYLRRASQISRRLATETPEECGCRHIEELMSQHL